MTWIHEIHDWPRFRWSAEVLAEPLARVRHKQGRQLGRIEALGFDLRSEAQLSTLTEEVVKSSAIENEHLDRDEVRSSIARRLGMDLAGLPQPGRMVEGVVEMMLDATRRHDAPLSAERLFGWHAALFPTGRSGMRPIAVGAWRPDDGGRMQVISGPEGRRRVHFEAPDAARVPAEMDAFLEWFEGEDSTDPVLRAALAHLWFVTIHPFEDGNGRIARAIAEMALARADGSRERTASMSSGIEARRREYYDRLESTQRGSLDVTAWMVWFLDCLESAVDGADAILGAVLRKAQVLRRASRVGLEERQRRVIAALLDAGEADVATSRYAELADCSTDTALRDIKDLVDKGFLERNPGRGRSTSYRLVEG